MRSLLTRLKRLERVRAAERQPPIELQIGYLKKLPPEYTGERHVATVGRLSDGKYQWEERPGPAASQRRRWRRAQDHKGRSRGGEGWPGWLLTRAAGRREDEKRTRNACGRIGRAGVSGPEKQCPISALIVALQTARRRSKSAWRRVVSGKPTFRGFDEIAENQGAVNFNKTRS